jgi:hypothetical protein
VTFKALAALAALAVAQPSSAAIITVTVSGTLSSGFDQSGMFGAANTDLTGAIFSVVEYFDTTKGQLVLGGSGGTSDILAGGFGVNGLPSPGSAIVTVNGISSSVSGNQIGLLQTRTNGATSSSQVNEVTFGPGLTTENGVAFGLSSSAPLHILDGWHTDCPAIEDCHGGFSFEQYTYLSQPDLPAAYVYSNHGAFDVDSIDVTVTAVPEPATWAMMIAGFGLTGAALRRRRALAVA